MTVLIVVVSALAQLDPVVEIYTWYSGLGAVGVIVMMALTSLAVVRFGITHRTARAPVPVLVLAGLGGLGLLVVLAISLANFPLLVGGTVAALICGVILVVVFVAGCLDPRRAAAADASDRESASAP